MGNILKGWVERVELDGKSSSDRCVWFWYDWRVCGRKDVLRLGQKKQKTATEQRCVKHSGMAY